MDDLKEHIGNCFLLTVPSELIHLATYEELLQEIEKTTQANAQVDRFLSGEIDDYELIEFMEQYVQPDTYIENVNGNLESWIGDRGWDW